MVRYHTFIAVSINNMRKIVVWFAVSTLEYSFLESYIVWRHKPKNIPFQPFFNKITLKSVIFRLNHHKRQSLGVYFTYFTDDSRYK